MYNMKIYSLLILLSSFSFSLKSQENLYTHSPGDNVTKDIYALQYMDIKLFVLKNGKIESYSDVNNAVGYSFDNVDVYLNPCDLDPMVAIDSIMPEENYCELILKIKFDSDLYNSFFQYISLKLIGEDVFMQPAYDDLDPNKNLKREDILIIVQDIIQKIGISYEY